MSARHPAISSKVAVETREVFLSQFAQAADVHVVFEVGELDATGDEVGGGALDKLFVSFAMMFGDAIQGFQNVRREALGGEFLQCPRCVFDNVVQDRDNFLIIGVHAGHDTEWMENVGLASPVLLTAMGFNRNRDGFFEERHSSSLVGCGDTSKRSLGGGFGIYGQAASGGANGASHSTRRRKQAFPFVHGMLKVPFVSVGVMETSDQSRSRLVLYSRRDDWLVASQVKSTP